eukprot:702852-Rhodomonas_salina.1
MSATTRSVLLPRGAYYQQDTITSSTYWYWEDRATYYCGSVPERGRLPRPVAAYAPNEPCN